jgi:hypothetical protein
LTHGQHIRKHMVKHRPKPWSTIISNHSQQSSNTIVKHQQNP